MNLLYLKAQLFWQCHEIEMAQPLRLKQSSQAYANCVDFEVAVRNLDVVLAPVFLCTGDLIAARNLGRGMIEVFHARGIIVHEVTCGSACRVNY